MATAQLRVDGDATGGVGDVTEVHLVLPGELAEQGDQYARFRCAHCGEALRPDHEGTFIDTYGSSECADDPDAVCQCDGAEECFCPPGSHRCEPAPLAFLRSVEVELDDLGDALEIRAHVYGEAKPIVTRIWRNPHGGVRIDQHNVPPTMWAHGEY